MPKKSVRVNIPSNPSEAIRLLAQVRDKHTALGASSPLAGLKWTEWGPAADRAAEHDAEAKKLERELQRRYGERDKDMPAVVQALRSGRDVLLGINSDNPRALGDFGYEVDDSPRAAAAAGAKTPTA